MAKDDADESEIVTKIPSERILKSLVKLSNTNRDKASSISGETGQAIRDAVDKHNLHPGAFKLAAKMYRMGRNDPVKLRSFLDHLDAYRDSLKIDDMKATMLEDAVAEGVKSGKVSELAQAS